jgi:glycosyltransferase involved in cell wall biosynthesis
MKCAVDIIMPLKNAGNFLIEALESIRWQTMPNFRVLMINDASTDQTVDIIQHYISQDDRFVEISCGQKGLVQVMNAGLAAAQSEWICRMDGDDVMDVRRLECQYRFGLQHSDVDVIGCRVVPISSDGITEGFERYITWVNRSLTHDEILADLYRESPLPHPGVMFRRSTIMRVGGYRDIDGPEDYDLWLRLAMAGVRFGKTPETLLSWRVHSGSASRTDSRYSRKAFLNVRQNFLTDFLIRLTAQTKRPIWICGAGKAGKKMHGFLLDIGIHPAGLIDVDPQKTGTLQKNTRVSDLKILPDILPAAFMLFTVGNWDAATKFENLMSNMGQSILIDYLIV